LGGEMPQAVYSAVRAVLARFELSCRPVAICVATLLVSP
jgi:hypothetical protein